MSQMRDQHSPEPAPAPAAVPETLALTPAAVEWVKRIRTKEDKEGQALRLGVKAGGCSGYSYFMGFTTSERAGDLVLRYDGLTVYVDPRSLEILRGTTVDYTRGLLGSGIQFQNPRVKKSCGCGESFSL